MKRASFAVGLEHCEGGRLHEPNTVKITLHGQNAVCIGKDDLVLGLMKIIRSPEDVESVYQWDHQRTHEFYVTLLPGSPAAEIHGKTFRLEMNVTGSVEEVGRERPRIFINYDPSSRILS